MTVLDAKGDLWSPVVPGLNVGVFGLIEEATGTKVNNLDSRLIELFEQNILWF